MTEELSSRALRPLARVIDDEETVRNSTVFTLRVAGIEAVAYESAAAFLENDDIRTPGCVILDVRMPDMNGLELQDEMLRRGIDLPIVFLTGHGDISMAVMALQKVRATLRETRRTRAFASDRASVVGSKHRSEKRKIPYRHDAQRL